MKLNDFFGKTQTEQDKHPKRLTNHKQEFEEAISTSAGNYETRDAYLKRLATSNDKNDTAILDIEHKKAVRKIDKYKKQNDAAERAKLELAKELADIDELAKRQRYWRKINGD